MFREIMNSVMDRIEQLVMENTIKDEELCKIVLKNKDLENEIKELKENKPKKKRMGRKKRSDSITNTQGEETPTDVTTKKRRRKPKQLNNEEPKIGDDDKVVTDNTSDVFKL